MLTQTQLFILALFISGSIGFHRGWERSVITSSIIILATWFMLMGGDVWFAQVLTNWQALGTMPTTQEIHAVSAPLYGAVFILAHMAGTHWGSAPKTSSQRWFGIIPGAVNGIAFLAYLGNWAAPDLFSQPFTTYFPLFFGFGVLVNIFFLFVTAKGSKSPKA
ncbi:MAG: hypothetical protein ACLQUY_17270 [Ktedonobacterales bacterium]